MLDDLRIYHRRAVEPLTLDRSRAYEQTAGYKPRGLWVSVGDDWNRWCQGEEMEWTTGVPVYSVRLNDGARDRLLVLDTESAIREMPTVRSHPLVYSEYVDWPAFAEQYGGIMIAPYQWGARYDIMWYYGWDCASGCIWDLSLVESVTEMAGVTPPHHRHPRPVAPRPARRPGVGRHEPDPPPPQRGPAASRPARHPAGAGGSGR